MEVGSETEVVAGSSTEVDDGIIESAELVSRPESELVATGTAWLVEAIGITDSVVSATGLALVVTETASLVDATGLALVDSGSALEVVSTTALEATALPLGAGAAGSLVSSARIHPEFLVMAAGQATCVKETVGLSHPANQSNRQLQPAWRASGKEEQSVAAEIPPY